MKIQNLQLCKQAFAEGEFSVSLDNAHIQGKVQKIADGYLISGEVRGRPGRLEILRFPLQSPFFFHNWMSWGPAWITNPEAFPKDIMTHVPDPYVYTLVPELWSDGPVSDYLIVDDQLLAGFLSSRTAHNFCHIVAGEVIVYTDYFDAEVAQPLDSLIILTGKPREDLLEIYSYWVSQANPQRELAWNPVGWCSWYHYFQELTWAETVKNLKLARQYPYEVFQIDDSYQSDIGDWLNTKGDFPAHEKMTAEIAKAEMVPGIWTAPFSVSETSQMFHQHPDWLVADADCQPKLAYRNWNKKIYAFDTTHPQVQKWLHKLFTILQRAGYHYFKIDFLFAAALPGKRRDPVTPIAAYREGLRIIREAVGNDFILGCGAPLLPSVGLVDGMRVGPDTAPFWDEDKTFLHGPNAYHALQTSLLRQFMHSRWWHNDPDCLLLRHQNIEMTEEQRRLFAEVAGLLDNMILQSDDLACVNEKGKEILQQAIAARGQKSKVVYHDRHLYSIKIDGPPAETWMVNLGRQEQSMDGQTYPAFSLKRKI